MLKSAHAQILNKPYSQIKDLKLYCADELESIKENHKSAWQIFKAFNHQIYQNLPNHFVPPHIQNWCNGWEIRRHFFAYYKYDKYISNAPMIEIVLNKQRLIIALTWHSYKAAVSKSTLIQFNNWINDIDFDEFNDFYFWHSSINEYGQFKSVVEFDYNKVQLSQNEFYRLGKFIEREDLDKFGDDELINWAAGTIERLSKVYECCHE